MKNLLAEIAMQLVDYPEQVKVKEIDGGHTMVLELYVAKEDIGKILGEKGSKYWSHPHSYECGVGENTQADYR